MATPLKQSLPSLGRIYRRFRGHLSRERPLIAGSVFALLAGTALRLLEPFPLKIAFDRVVQARKQPKYLAGLSWLDELDPSRVLLVAAVSLVGITLLRALADYANRVGFAKLGNRVLTRVRNELFSHLQVLPLSFHTSARAGDLIVRVISDVNMLRDVMVTAILPVMANALVLVGMWGVMFWLNWRLAVLGIATFPLLVLITSLLSVQIRAAARKQRKKEGAMASTAAEAVTSMRVVQAFGLESKFAESFQSRSNASQQQDVKTARLSAKLERSVDVLLAVATALVLWYGVKLVLWGELTPGDLIIFLAYLRRAYNPVQDFAKYTGRLAKAGAAGERVLDLLDRTPEIRDLPDARPAPAFAGRITFEQVVFAYDTPAPVAEPAPVAGAGSVDGVARIEEPGSLSAGTERREVLDGLTLEIPAGTRAAIVGPSGIGKSTVAGLLLRLYEPQGGRILIDGADVRSFTLASLRKQIGVVLQDSLLFAETVRENIRYGRAGASDAEVEAAARLANAHEFVTAMPQRYDTALGERGVTLSGGQRQRLAIARTALRDAPILLLDEPTTGLDEENQRVVMAALDRVSAGRTTVFVTHDLTLASRADVIFYLDGGRVAESGTHKELVALGGRYAGMYRLQSLRSPGGAAGDARGGGEDRDDQAPPAAVLRAS
jgi:ATP-binding cassette subfamily B protein